MYTINKVKMRKYGQRENLTPEVIRRLCISTDEIPYTAVIRAW